MATAKTCKSFLPSVGSWLEEFIFHPTHTHHPPSKFIYGLVGHVEISGKQGRQEQAVAGAAVGWKLAAAGAQASKLAWRRAVHINV